MQPNYPPGYGQPTYPPAQPQFQPPQYQQAYQPQPQPIPQYPQQVAPAAAAGNLPSGDFADPRGGGGDLMPRVRHLVGRTVIIEPVRIDENAKGLPDSAGNATSRPAAYANLTVVDGGPIEFGDEVKAGRTIRPNTHRIDAPLRIMNMLISNTWLVNAIRDAMPPMGNGLLLGVIEIGTQGNSPFLLTKVSETVTGQDRPDGQQRREAARQLWERIKAGQFTNPTPVLLTPVAGSAYQQQPQMYGPTPQQYQQQPQYAPVNQVSAAPMPQQAPPAPAGLSPGFDPSQCPPGWDAGQWQAIAANPAQTMAIWQNILSQQAQQQQAPAQAQYAAPDSPPPF
jgi:hypothetical protein